MRKKIFDIIEPSAGNNNSGSAYDWFMMSIIFISIIPLCFKGTYKLSEAVDLFCLIIFIADYLLRWLTADYKYNKKTILSFVRYPFGLPAIVDLIAILPSVSAINSGFKLFKLFRMIRAFRVFRVFKAFRHSKSIKIIVSVFKKSEESLIAVGILAVSYIIISALVIFNVEPDSFENFFDAVYWATISLTTVGYGDIYPITTIGRIVTMVSSFLGIAVVALPAGIITAGYMQEIENEKNNSEQ
ncbi:MAG: ion transporter [Oscillospiraceae bacterium]|nr:ion transporter [Oscillospiraceae bacterium]